MGSKEQRDLLITSVCLCFGIAASVILAMMMLGGRGRDAAPSAAPDAGPAGPSVAVAPDARAPGTLPPRPDHPVTCSDAALTAAALTATGDARSGVGPLIRAAACGGAHWVLLRVEARRGTAAVFAAYRADVSVDGEADPAAARHAEEDFAALDSRLRTPPVDPFDNHVLSDAALGVLAHLFQERFWQDYCSAAVEAVPPAWMDLGFTRSSTYPHRLCAPYPG